MPAALRSRAFPLPPARVTVTAADAVKALESTEQVADSDGGPKNSSVQGEETSSRPPSPKAAPKSVLEVVDLMLDTRPGGLLPMVRGFAEADLRDVLSRVAVPTLLLYGDADQRSPRHVAVELHARIPGSELVVLPGVGHDSALEAPAAFNVEVHRFLEAHRNA